MEQDNVDCRADAHETARMDDAEILSLSGHCGAEGCQREALAEGVSLLQCSACLGSAAKGGLYCSTSCQKEHWPIHRAYCTAIQMQLDTMAPKARLRRRILIRWWRKNMLGLMAMSTSGLDLMNYPENAQRLYIHMSASYVEDKIDIQNVSIRSLNGLQVASEVRCAREAAEQNVRLHSPSGAALVLCLQAEQDFSHGIIKLTARLPTQILIIEVRTSDLHRERKGGMPDLNWKLLFLAGSSSKFRVLRRTPQVLEEKTYIGRPLPHPPYSEANPGVIKALEAMSDLVHPALEEAYMETLLRTQRAVADHFLIVYVWGRFKTVGASFRFISAAHYSVTEFPTIYKSAEEDDGTFLAGLQDLMKPMREHPDDEEPASLGMVILHLICTSSKILVPLLLPDSLISSYHRALNHRRRDWRENLLLKLNGRKIANIAQKEADAGDPERVDQD